MVHCTVQNNFPFANNNFTCIKYVAPGKNFYVLSNLGVEILTHADRYSKTNKGLIMSNFLSVYIQIQKSSEKVALKNTYPYHFKHKS